MPEQPFDTLPSEAQELPQGAQNVFQAALAIATEDGMSQDAATRVAWNSVKS
ncbi:MAG: ChaB family protein [Microcoleus sp.]